VLEVQVEGVGVQRDKRDLGEEIWSVHLKEENYMSHKGLL
jgi:hypothetical protein